MNLRCVYTVCDELFLLRHEWKGTNWFLPPLFCERDHLTRSIRFDGLWNLFGIFGLSLLIIKNNILFFWYMSKHSSIASEEITEHFLILFFHLWIFSLQDLPLIVWTSYRLLDQRKRNIKNIGGFQLSKRAYWEKNLFKNLVCKKVCYVFFPIVRSTLR
jgi:hypothetical protein